MAGDAPNLRFRAGGKIFIGTRQHALTRYIAPMQIMLLFGLKMSGDVGEGPTPFDPFAEIGSEARPSAVQRIAAEPDDRRLRQDRGKYAPYSAGS